jgi:nucleoside-diphosphate-sugar epimerase
VRITVTGGTGFVGSHSVARLVQAGHQVRLLVRTPSKVMPALAPLGVTDDAVEVVPGDIVDEASVTAALDGAEACLHAAAVVATRRRDMPIVGATNLRGAEIVLGAAVARGLDPVVHVSSVGAVFPSPTGLLSADDPVARSRSRYGQSKADCEVLARRLQADGHPVVIVYPGGVAGPHDAGLNALAQGFVRFVEGRMFPLPRSGGVLLVDVRDLALVHARLMAAGRGPRRYMAGGHFLTWPQTAALFERVLGRRLRKVSVPVPTLLAIGHLADAVARLLPVELPLDHETAYYMSHLCPTDDTAVAEDLGVRWRAPEETVRDTLEWLVDAGHLSPARAGRLGEERVPDLGGRIRP